MKFYRKGSFLFSVLLLVIVLTFVLFSIGYDAEARLIPLIIGVPSLALAILLVLSERYPRLLALFKVSQDSVVRGAPSELASSETAVGGRKVLTFLAWIVGFVILVFLVGFLITTPVFIFLFLKIRGRIGWFRTLVMSIVVGGFIYGVFEILMRGDMFKGILFGELLPPL